MNSYVIAVQLAADVAVELVVEIVFDLAVDLQPLETQPIVCCIKWIRKVRCLSAASFELFPFFAAHKREPEGQRRCGRASAAPFFCLTLFFWPDKEK